MSFLKKKCKKHGLGHDPQLETLQNEWNNCASNSHLQRKKSKHWRYVKSDRQIRWEVCATRGIFLKNLKHTMTFLCLKWFDSSPWPGITFYLLGTALGTLNLAPTWPLLVWLLLGSLPITSFFPFPKRTVLFHTPLSLSRLKPLLWDWLSHLLSWSNVCLIQIQLKCHLFSESLHPLLRPYYIPIHLSPSQKDKLLEGKSQLTPRKKKKKVSGGKKKFKIQHF